MPVALLELSCGRWMGNALYCWGSWEGAVVGR